MEQRRIRLETSGRKLSAWSSGEGGPCVVLIAGGGTPAALSPPLKDRLAEHSGVLSYDRAGLGDSAPSPRALTFEEQACDLADLLTASGECGPFILVAESFG